MTSTKPELTAFSVPVTLSDSSNKTLVESSSQVSSSFWTIFGSTFLTIFLAEMGDKTQLATLLISAESHSPWIVFAGAATALVTTSLLGVLLGCWLSKRISPKTTETAAAVLLLLIAAMLLWDVVQG